MRKIPWINLHKFTTYKNYILKQIVGWNRKKSTNSRNSGNFNLLISWTKKNNNNGIEIKIFKVLTGVNFIQKWIKKKLKFHKEQDMREWGI